MAKENKKPGQEKDEIVGKVEYHIEVFSPILNNKRDIVVWLPIGYNPQKNPDKKYPVLYMHDGQNILDPKTAYVGKDWRVDETVMRLIKQKKIKEIIVVGIYNSSDRLDEYSWTEKGQNYLKFIVTELKPYIDSKYKTLSDKENTAIMGSSMGGLISFYAAWHYPEVFSMAGCLSSSFYYNNDRSIKQVEDYSGHKKHVKFYIDHGEDGNVRGQRMFVELSKKGYVIGNDIDYFYAPGAEHNEREWAARLERPLIFFFGNR
ncbi:MAG: alpha/beta hydrolase-fold protein [Ignavibacteria bacterium]|nr:alpha/beta hydrolase-fold protein [Ignavibacteria bacterium]